jgi:PKD repeat protein
MQTHYTNDSVRKRTSVRLSRVLKLLLLSIALCTTSAYAQLSGTYTVCASGCDYASPSAAISALNSNGVSGPVTFNISAGTYSGNAAMYSISGASPTNTITFNGAGMGSTIWSSSSSYVLQMFSTSYTTFQNMSMNLTSSSYTVYMSGTKYITFDHVKISAPLYGSPSYIFAEPLYWFSYNNITMTNCRIEGGYYSYLSPGTGNGNSLFKNNKFVQFNYEGMYLYGYGAQNDVFDGNTFDSSAYTYGPYGLYAYYENGLNVVNNKFFNCGLEIYSPNYTSSTNIADISNNFVIPADYSYGTGLYVYSGGTNVRVAHNTVYVPSTHSGIGYGAYIYSTGSAGMTLMDNIFDIEVGANYYAIYIAGSASSYAKLDGNDYFTGSTTGGLAQVNVLGTAYTSYKALYSGLTSKGFGTYSSNIKPTYVAAAKNDLHLNQGTPNPSGVYAGIDKDIDGDPRCKLFPSAGADESNYGKTSKPTAKFFGPSTVYSAAPTIFYNTAKVGMPQVYRWYVNGVYVTDSLHLKTQLALYPSVTIALKVTNCAGSDSVSQTFSVSYPSAAPVSDFIADKNSIQVGDVVRFTDLSSNGASTWQWDITPDSTFSFGAKVPTYKYIFGNSTAQNPQIQFLASGNYKVCLTASNTLTGGKVGKGNTVCKNAYIYVLPSINLGSVTSTREPKGYIYDDGGPNGNYYSTTSYPKPTVQGLLIDACADSTYLVFQSFGTYCGYDYVKVFDGKDNTGTQLTKTCSSGSKPSTSSGSWLNGPGYTGGGSYASCTYTCLPNLSTSGGKVDTFKAGKQMYVEMDMYPGFSNPGIGFAAYYWTKPRTEPKPTADFTTSQAAHHDSICAGGIISFNNTSKGSDMTYQWELDGDYTDGFETTTQNASWLWLFPTEAQVTLIATNCGGPDTITKTIHVFAPASPVAAFKADNTNPTINDLVFLTSTVPQCVDDYKWTVTKTYASVTDTGHAQFAMGTTPTNANPVLMFTDTGYYTVTLFVDNGGGSQKDQITKKAYIYVKNGYCVPSVAQLNSGLGITNVSFNGINNRTSQGVNDYTSYVNNASLSTTVELGVTYPITIQRDTPYYEAITRTIFIDWNRDGVFESNEVVAVDSNDTKSATWMTSIKIPKTASIGATVMRIATNRGSYTNQPCGQNQYGEYEDYRLYVRPDQTAPVIYLKGKDSMQLEQGYTFVEPGDSAWDNLNGNISANITRTSNKPNSFSLTGPALIPGDYIISYNVKDSTGNPAVTKHRYITVLQDTGRPNLVVSGPDTTFVLVNKASTGTVTLPAIISSEDLVDGTTADTISPNSIPVNKLDTVKVMYSTADQTGNRAVVYRYVVIYDNVAPVLTMVGKSTQYVAVNSTYTDSGVTTSDNYYTSKELDGLVQTTNSVNMKKIGTYTIVYTLTDPSGNKATPLVRTVNVVDTAAPVLTLHGAKSDTIDVFSTYNDLGVTAIDNYDSVVTVTKTGTYYTTFPTGKATKLGTYTIIYSATDGSGNKASVTRFVTVVDRIAPVISLLGDPTVAVCRWADYRDSGYSVKDNYYATVKVDTEGTFISKGGTTIQGLYSLRYKATDGSGNVSYSDYRYVYVRPADDQLCKTGIKEGLTLDKYINVYPNPTSGMLTITANLPTQERVVMTITNALGQTVATVSNGNLSQNSFSVDLSGQSAGIYMLTIQSAHDKVTKQIMLTK